MPRLLRPLVRLETYRALLHAIAGVALGCVGFAVVVAGWCLTLSLSITPLVFPVLFGFRWTVGQLARAQGIVANGLLGTRVSPPTRTTRGASFWSRSLNVVRDGAFWRQQAHLLLGCVVGGIALIVVYQALQLLTLPLWYRWSSSDDVVGWLEIDSVLESLPVAAVGVVLLVVAAHVLRPYAWISRRLANRLLSGEPQPRRSAAALRLLRFRAAAIVFVLASTAAGALVVIWSLTGRGTFWPVWPILSLALVVAISGWIVGVLENEDLPRIALGSRALAIQVGASVAVLGFLVGVWAAAGRGYFWPIWVALGLVLPIAAHAAVIYGRRKHRLERLEESRAAAVDVQETELRRIERDLHDGAQARLVALGMSLGMAEEKLRTDPEAARALLAEARTGAREALEELRDLARGIHPPILTDRGLAAAVEALAARSPVPVVLSADVRERPAAAVETAAYFVVAEALANATKHSGAARIDVTIRRANGTLVAEVVDDGRGGADPDGDGLRGLRQRVGALDGTLRVTSPVGGPTSVRAELPCG